MPLHELCRARALTQQTQAKEAENDLTRISNMEKRTDVSLRVLFFNATLLYLEPELCRFDSRAEILATIPQLNNHLVVRNAPPLWTAPKYMVDLIVNCIYVNMNIDTIVLLFSYVQKNENLRKKSISADTGWHFRDPPSLTANQSMYT